MIKRLWCVLAGHRIVSESYPINGDETALVARAQCARCQFAVELKLVLPVNSYLVLKEVSFDSPDGHRWAGGGGGAA